MFEVTHRKRVQRLDKRNISKADKVPEEWYYRPFETDIFLLLFLVRLINAFSVRTFFQADEFYQSLDPAHAYSFGYGYLTWEWKKALRSSIHPLLYSLGYSMIPRAFDNPILVLLVPKLIGAIIATSSEFYLYKFVQVFSKDELLAKISLGLSILSAFNWYFITRSFSNNLEMLFSIIALRYWPWNKKLNTNLYVSTFLAFLSCIVRPTNALLWSLLGLHFLYDVYLRTKKMIHLVWIIISLALELSIVISISAVLDRIFYGRWTFPLYNFIEFNLLQNLSIFYGVEPWHFYILQGVPAISLTYLPFLLHYIFFMKGNKTILVRATIIVIFAFSLIGHKEIRFIYPLQPLFIFFSAISLKKIINGFNLTRFLAIQLFLNITVALFFTQIHESGEMGILEYIRTNPKIESFGFLTPCHSTPWQSHLHNPQFQENSWFLTCEPPIHMKFASSESVGAYMDESDHFFADPVSFLDKNFPPLHCGETSTSFKYKWPSHLIIFEPIEDLMKAYLGDSYHECERLFNSYFHWDERRKGDIIVFCRN